MRRAADLTGLSRGEIIGDCRRKAIVRARYAVCHVARRELGKSSAAIGRALGGRDHSTILNAFRRAEELISDDQDFARLCSALEAAFELACKRLEDAQRQTDMFVGAAA